MTRDQYDVLVWGLAGAVWLLDVCLAIGLVGIARQMWRDTK